MNRRYDRVTIIGVGLLGASLALALKARGLVGAVRGVGHRQVSLDKALEVGAIDHAHLDAVEACADADLVVLATPAALVPDLLDQIRPVCPAEAVITDVASTKAAICAHARDTWPKPLRFVGSHPMAGSEKFGPEHATPDLYDNTVTIVESRADDASDAWNDVAGLWKAVGCSVVELDPALHDALLARTSHLPHIVAASLALVAATHDAASTVVGNGFRDATRIAAGRSEIWRDICLTNPTDIVQGIEELEQRLAEVRQLVESGDGEALDAFFRAGQAARTKATGE